jgi:hypothetical protein
MSKIFNYGELHKADLVVDAIYKGATTQDPIAQLLEVSRQRGFRYRGTTKSFDINYVVLYSTLSNPDWPDRLDYQTGHFTYYGDNRNPGKELHDTYPKGNKILRECFNAVHLGDRSTVPPFFVFTRVDGGVMYRGLAVPGATSLTSSDDLVAMWKIKDEQRFQNYRAIFTILDIATIPREWINDLIKGDRFTENTPPVWQDWVTKGTYKPLIAERSIDYRKKDEQLPVDENGKEIIGEIIDYFEDGYAFEKCATEIIKLMDNNIVSCDLTRPWSDGGRDAMGKYRIGIDSNSILVEFALEAKRYKLNNSVGVKGTSRLISRLRHRQFGILITTSYLGDQAYKEIIEDGHPVIIVCARDIVEILGRAHINDRTTVRSWLEANFSPSISSP